jgi:hypothetical protein
MLEATAYVSLLVADNINEELESPSGTRDGLEAQLLTDQHKGGTGKPSGTSVGLEASNIYEIS